MFKKFKYFVDLEHLGGKAGIWQAEQAEFSLDEDSYVYLA